MEEDETNRKSEKKKGLKIILDTCDTRAHKHTSTHTSAPGEEDAFHNVEILHQHISLRLGAEVANSITNTQLDGPLQSRGGGLEAVNREKNNRVKCGWEVVGENRDDKQTYKRQRQIERDEEEKPAFLYVVSPEASTLLWPIFFSWAGPVPNGDGICQVDREGNCKCIHDVGTENSMSHHMDASNHAANQYK